MTFKKTRSTPFRVKAAELRQAASDFDHPALKTAMLELADRWERLDRQIDAEGIGRKKVP